MTDTPRIEGTPDPRKSSQLSSDDPVDSEKFKRILKVEDSDEAQKQHKRRKPKKTEEEEEETELKEADQNIPKGDAFKSFLEKTKKEDLFAVKGGKKLEVAVSSKTVDLKQSPFELSAADKKKKETSLTPSINFKEALPKAFAISTKNIPLIKKSCMS